MIDNVEPIAVLGAGAAGLVTAHVLIQDGFTNVQVFSRDKSVGGVWARQRIYPGLSINNVHGEFRFSSLEMPPPIGADKTGGRLTGEDMANYMETFAGRFLKGKLQMETEILDIQRSSKDELWSVTIQRLRTGVKEELKFARIVLCTGGCSNPYTPPRLSPKQTEFTKIMAIHSSAYAERLNDILARVPPVRVGAEHEAPTVVVVGGGKSAQDISAHLANEGRKVTIVFDKADAFLASPVPLPAFIRRSRFLSVLSPHIELRTRLERFLHNTWIGGKIVHFLVNKLVSASFGAYGIPKDSPLRNAHSLFWSIRFSDEGVVRPNSFRSLANAGRIQVVSPAHVEGYADDGESLVLDNGQTLKADVVILATGFTSSWDSIISKEAKAEIGLGRETLQLPEEDEWDYTSLRDPPPSSRKELLEPQYSSIYKGLIPAKRITKRDFAINGAAFSANNGYMFEVSAHWISSYFRGDPIRHLPASIEEARNHTRRNSAWLRKRFPGLMAWVNESYSSDIAFWNWPQVTDELLEDMYLPSHRSGGNWLTWPFKVIDIKEIENLAEERKHARAFVATRVTRGS